jgi:hypothetical protein
MTFQKLAEEILKLSDEPLTANEIWQKATEIGLDSDLESKGKTPWATLGARLYVIVRDNPKSIFKSIGKRPKRFYLKDKKYDINFTEYEQGIPEERSETVKKYSTEQKYSEKDLHSFLAYFAYYHLSCYTKTINHSKSGKKEFGEWVHPDMVGCIFPIDDWDNEVLQLSSVVGNTSIKFISFEIKKELNLSTLREKFFQTVSNSSWANESYLVASEISNNSDFLSELSRLSASFGIGLIRLEIEDPNSSEIILQPKTREYLDWETINKLTMNTDFKEFLKRVRIDLSSNEIRREKYDKILSENELINKISS